MISEHYYHHLLVLGAIFFSHDKNQGRSPGNNTGTMPRFEGPAIIHQEMDLPGNSGPDFMAVVGKIGHEFHNWTFFEALPVATPWPGIMICRCSQVEVAKERALRLGVVPWVWAVPVHHEFPFHLPWGRTISAFRATAWWREQRIYLWDFPSLKVSE